MLTFASFLSTTSNPVLASVLLLLAWVASSDGKVDDRELASLRQIAGESLGPLGVRDIISIAQGARAKDIQLACEVIQRVDNEGRKLILKMALGLSLADGVLTAGESHIIRLLADIARVPPRILGEIFQDMTGKSFPPAADLSDPTWWAKAESRRSRNYDPAPSGVAESNLQRLKDLAVLGLDEGASLGEIRDAYKRMSRVHHPDKFACLGEEAVRAAEVSFCRIQAAYERLVKS